MCKIEKILHQLMQLLLLPIMEIYNYMLNHENNEGNYAPHYDLL